MIVTMVFAVLIIAASAAARVRNILQPEKRRTLQQFLQEKSVVTRIIMIALAPFFLAVFANAAWNGMVFAGIPLEHLPYWSWQNFGLVLAVLCLKKLSRPYAEDEPVKEDSA